MKKGFCTEFLQSGRCSRGDGCRMSHGKPHKDVCTKWLEFNCSKGLKCRFKHEVLEDVGSSKFESSQGQKSLRSYPSREDLRRRDRSRSREKVVGAGSPVVGAGSPVVGAGSPVVEARPPVPLVPKPAGSRRGRSLTPKSPRAGSSSRSVERLEEENRKLRRRLRREEAVKQNQELRGRLSVVEAVAQGARAGSSPRTERRGNVRRDSRESRSPESVSPAGDWWDSADRSDAPANAEVLFQLGKGKTRKVFLCKRAKLLCVAKQGDDECNEAERRAVDLLELRKGAVGSSALMKSYGFEHLPGLGSCPVYEFCGPSLADLWMSDAAESWVMQHVVRFVKFLAGTGLESFDSLKAHNWAMCPIDQVPKCIDLGDAQSKHVVLPYEMIVYSSSMITSKRVREVYESVSKKATSKRDKEKVFSYMRTQTVEEFQETFIELQRTLQVKFQGGGADVRSLLKGVVTAFDKFVKQARTCSEAGYQVVQDYDAAARRGAGV